LGTSLSTEDNAEQPRNIKHLFYYYTYYIKRKHNKIYELKVKFVITL
jgi:hypothetical protein